MEEENWDTDPVPTAYHDNQSAYIKADMRPRRDQRDDSGNGGERRRPDDNRQRWGDKRSMNGGGGDRSSDRGGGGGGGGAITMQVEFGKKGAVIGRGGAKIREIQEQFECKVDLGKCVFGVVTVRHPNDIRF